MKDKPFLTGDVRASESASDGISAKVRAEQRLEKLLDPTRNCPEHPRPKIPDHELIRRIGRGAYGEVWLAKNVMGTYRAVKVVYRDSFREERPYEREFRGIQKFEPVSRSNEGLIDILQIGRNDEEGWFYYVMELADHERPGASNDSFDPENYIPATLRNVVRERGRLAFEECLQFALPLTLALGHLHRHGLIHRDIKPSNIVFIRGIPKLADIGLVTDVEEARSIVGTEGFIPPEGPNSPQADIYSLGKVLYEISMGKDRSEFPEPFTALGLPGSPNDLEELNALILKACAVNPKERYQTAEELHVDLALLQDGKSLKSRRVVEERLVLARKGAAIVGVAAIVATGAYFYQRHQTREAKRQHARAEHLAGRMQIQYAEDLLQRGRSALGLAHLADVLRRDPGNRVAAERTMSALLQRSFPALSIGHLRHSADLSAAHFSRDGQQIVSGTVNGTLHLWNAQKGTGFTPKARHRGRVNSIEFSPDGLLVATTGGDNFVHVLDSRNGTAKFKALSHPEPVNAAIFRPLGLSLATACADGKIRLFSAENGQLISTLPSPKSPLKAIAFNAGGSWLAGGTQDGIVQIWDVAGGVLWHQFEAGGPVEAIAWSPNGEFLAAAFRDQGRGAWAVRVFDSKSRQTILLPHQHRIYSIHFNPEGDRLITAATEAARVWDVRSGQNLFSMLHREAVYAASFNPEGNRILTASVDQTARLWDATSGDPISEPFLHNGRVIHAEFSPAGDQILTASWDKTVRVWQIPKTPRPPKRMRHKSWVKSAEFDSSGSRVISTTGQTVYTAGNVNGWALGAPQAVCIWNVGTGAAEKTVAVPLGAEALMAQFTARGALALIADRPINSEKAFRAEQAFGDRAQVWDIESQTPLGGSLEFQTDLNFAAFSSDGRFLAVALDDGILVVRDLVANITRTGGVKHDGGINSVRFNNLSTAIVTAGNDGRAIVWRAQTAEPIVRELSHESPVSFAQFSSAGNRVLSITENFVHVWATNGVCTAIIEDSGAIEYAEFSPDSHRIVTASVEGRARLWNAETGEELTDPLEHNGLVFSARFSPDGLRIVTASKDGTAQLWDANTGAKLADPFQHGERVVNASFSPDGTKVVTASLDHNVRIWEVPIAAAAVPAWFPELAEAIAGHRRLAGRPPVAITWDRFAEIKIRLQRLSETDPYIDFARFFSAGFKENLKEGKGP